MVSDLCQSLFLAWFRTCFFVLRQDIIRYSGLPPMFCDSIDVADGNHEGDTLGRLTTGLRHDKTRGEVHEALMLEIQFFGEVDRYISVNCDLNFKPVLPIWRVAFKLAGRTGPFARRLSLISVQVCRRYTLHAYILVVTRGDSWGLARGSPNGPISLAM